MARLAGLGAFGESLLPVPPNHPVEGTHWFPVTALTCWANFSRAESRLQLASHLRFRVTLRWHRAPCAWLLPCMGTSVALDSGSHWDKAPLNTRNRQLLGLAADLTFLVLTSSQLCMLRRSCLHASGRPGADNRLVTQTLVCALWCPLPQPVP